jgi:serine/threonine protein kinase
MSSAETDGIPGAKPGDILCGKYRVEKVLGAGGMGVVVSAMHLQLDEMVAIKFLLPDAAKSADVVNRFQREARAAVKIKSEHVARVKDVGQLDNGAPFMVMEFLQGQDLAGTIEAQGALPISAAVEYVLQACEALAEAHSAGIVHRDLKPANLFLAHRADGSPCIKVLDFGISKIVGSLSMPGMTRTTAVMGSPLYMSPEQMKSSKDVDHRTDIWSLGAILYELLSGEPPFIADTMPQLCMMIMQEPLPPLAQLRRDVPPQLEAVVRRCQEKEASQRYQNVAELSAALAPFVTGRARLSAERIADVLRTQSSVRSGGTTGPQAGTATASTPAPPPAGAPQQPYGATGNPYGAPTPMPPGAQYGSPNQGMGQGGPAYGSHPGPPYVAQAQTGNSFGPYGAQSNAALGGAATVMGAPNIIGMSSAGPGGTMQGHHGPPMGGSTASSWEGQLGAPKKKSSMGVIIGAIAGVAFLAVVGIAIMAFSGGGSKDTTGAANNTIPTPTGAADKPTNVGPAVLPGSEGPVASASATATVEPTASATAATRPGKLQKPIVSATASATTAPVTAPSTTAKPLHPSLEDDRK